MSRKIGCLLFSLALLLVAIFVFWRARTPPRVGEDFARLAPQVKAERRESVRQLQTAVENVVRSSRNNEHKPFTITATEEQLNTLLQDSVRIKNAPIRDLRLGLSSGELALQGRVNYKGFNSVVTLRGNVSVENEKLRCNLRELQFGILPAPSSVRKKTEKAITDILNDNVAKAPGVIERVEIARKTLIIEGTTD